MSNLSDEILEEASAYQMRHGHQKTWEQVNEDLDLPCSGTTLKWAVHNWRKKQQEEMDRLTPMFVDKFNWSFLNNFWNSGIVLTEYERKDWHHPKEKRDRADPFMCNNQ